MKQAGKLLRRPIFVPFTVPGDVIVADLVEQKRKYLWGEVSAVVKESPERRQPTCKHFMTCGGCNLQHVSYKEQLRQKAKHVAFLLQRKGVRLPGEILTKPSVDRHKYRWRARVAVQFGEKGCVAGFRKHRSREIVAISECFVVHERIMEVIRMIQTAETSIRDVALEVTLVIGSRGKVGMLIVLDEISRQQRQEIKTFFEDVYARNRQVIGNVFFSEEGRTRSYGQVQEHFAYEANGFTFTFLPETFIQANISTDGTLISQVVLLALRHPKPRVILDLYAGIGNLSLPLGKEVEHVIGVEGNDASVLAATTNAIRNDVRNVTFFKESVERYIREYAKRYKRGAYVSLYPKADAIVLDPPRTGLTPAVIKELLLLGLDRVIYVSCNPTTLAHDLAELQKKYVVSEITCVDMFPDVSHVETVVRLQVKQS